MDKRVFFFLDEQLTAERAAQSELKAIIGMEGVSVMARNEAGVTLALQSWQFAGGTVDFENVESDLRKILGEEKIFSLPFGRSHCALSVPNVTLVPRRLFSEEDLSIYFKLLLQPGEALEFGYEEISEFGCYLVWATEPGLLRLCQHSFPTALLKHLAPSLLRSFRHLAPPGGYEVFVNLRNQTAQIAVLDRQSLLFYNSFQFAKPNDLLYFVLLAYDQFRLSPLDIPLTLSGDLLEDSDVFRLLHRYVQRIRFAPLPLPARLPAGIENLPDHCWLDLFSL